MPSLLSITTTILLLLLFSSIHVSSGLTSRRHLALDDQDEDQDPPLKLKKKLANFDNTHLLKPKKKVADNDQDELTPPKPKKKAAVIEEDGDLPLLKPKKKKEIEPPPPLKLKKKAPFEEEEKIIPSVKAKRKDTLVEDNSLVKTKKKVIIAEGAEATQLKLKKGLTESTKKVNFDSKNQTKPMKPKKTSSNSTTITTSFDKPINKTTTSKSKKTNSTMVTSRPQHPSNPRDEAGMASWFDSDDITTIPDDLISDFRELPSRLLPDLSRLSTTSKAYISRANLEIARNVKPYVGHHAAATVASIASAALLALPLLLLTLVFHRVKTYLTLQRLLIFIQAYLAIYFATLAFIALLTGLEPLRFFAAASPPSYAVVQTIQTLGYVVYLVVQMLHVAAGGEGRWLGLAQMLVGLAVGVHYYAAVFHRAVAGEPPRANWKVHAVYAACFVVICACARAERRKKAHLARGGGDDDDGKKS